MSDKTQQQDEELDGVISQSPATVATRWPDPIMNFIIAYDISDPKRLRMVAKGLELHARRVQKSLFVFTGSRNNLEGLMRSLLSHIDAGEDRIQAWPIRTSTRACRIDVGGALPETGVAIVASPSQWLLIEAIDEPSSENHAPLVMA